jgi:hypothetical protein
MSAGKKQQIMVPKPPSSSGNTIAVSRRIVPNPDGTASVELQLQLDGAPTPERRYTADVAWFDHDADFVRLHFGQLRRDSILRSLVIVRLPVEAVRRLLRAVDPFLLVARGYLDKNEIPSRSIAALESEPEQTVALTANIMSAAQVGRECCMDLFHLSAWDLRNTMQGGNSVGIEPVLRVDAATSLIVPLLEKLLAEQETLPREAP